MVFSPPLSTDTINGLVALLERHCDTYPALSEELRRHRTLSRILAQHEDLAARALSAWRAAISERWEREVQAQRVYRLAQQQLGAYYGADPAYTQLIAPAHPGGAITPGELLHELRRIEASLELLLPRPPFAAALLAELQAAREALARAMERTEACEAERRNVLAEQRIAVNLYERAYDRSRRLIVRYLGEQAPALPVTCTVEPMAAGS